MATNDPGKVPKRKRAPRPISDEDAERQYRAEMRRIKLLQRRLRIWLSVLFVGGPFLYVMVATIARSFGAAPADLPWALVLPFTITGVVLIFGLDYRTAIVLFGGFFANLGASLAKMGAPPVLGTDTDDEEDE